jgi:predicted phage terminase large subunit-like protein
MTENEDPEKYKLLLVSMPPRHGKTMLASKHLPPWYLGKFPDNRVILASYSQDLSNSNSDTAKNNFEKWGPFLFNVEPSKTMFKKTEWETEYGGGTLSTGVGGGATGFGADLFVIDDYIKDYEEAESPRMRQRVWDWWTSVALTRLHPGAVIIIIATRWHDDDLIGRLKKQMKEDPEEFPFECEEINFPAIATKDNPDTILNREEGEALWPSRFSAKRLANVKKAVGGYIWNALFQGNPTPRGGTLFKRDNFRYYERDGPTGNFLCWREGEKEPLVVNKKNLTKHAFLDPAIEIKKTNDPSGMGAWAYDSKNKIWLLLDVVAERIEFTKVDEMLYAFAYKNDCSLIGVENEKLGKVIIKQSAGRDTYNGKKYPMKEIPTKGLDKYTRAVPMATYIENERVFFLKGASWLDFYEDQLIRFPNAEHDECVDITSMASEMEAKMSISEILQQNK